MNLFSIEEENDFDINSINNILNSYPPGILSSPIQERPFEHTEYTEQLPEIIQEAIINIFPNENQEQSDDDIANENQNDNGNNVIPEIVLSPNIPEDLGVLTLTKKVGTTFSLMKVYDIEDIKKHLDNNKISKDVIEKINKDDITKEDKQNVGYLYPKEKRKRSKTKTTKTKTTETKATETETTKTDEKKLGRKRKGTNKKGSHTKNDVDNVIKKIKRVFFDKSPEYVAKVVNYAKSDKKQKFILGKLSYEYIDKLKKENELALFQMKLKDLLSLNISSKCSLSKDKEFNKKNINRILEEEKDNKVIIDLLNMNFDKWIDVFTLKTSIENVPEFDGFEKTLKDISEIKDEDSEKKDGKYFSRFIFYLFNYQNYFKNKKGRSSKQIKLKNHN